MFNQYVHQGVDAIQSAKKQFVNTFVQHEQLQKVLNNFVDAQTQYTKSAIEAGSKAATETVEILTDRTPYVKLAEKLSAYFPTANFTKSSKKAS